MGNIQSNLSILNNMLLRNTSSVYTKLLNIDIKKSFIDIYELDINNIYENVIIKNKETKIYTKKLSETDKTYVKQKLDNIQSEYDKGKKNSTSDLYIGYYFIDGYIAKNRYIRGPLFTIPCELKKNKSENKIEVEYILNPLQDEPILNAMLIMEICKYNSIEIDENLINSVEIIREDEEVDIIQKIFNAIGAKYYIEDNNNEDTRFVKFKSYPKGENPKLEEFLEENRFRLTKSMVLGIFNKNKPSIYNNYLSLINKAKNSDNMGLLQNILSSELDEDNYDKFNGKDKNIVNNTDESDKYFLSQLDFSQEEAVLSVGHKEVVTIEGPPGTGKSEVIASIISNNIMKNKNILMVCEKDVALKVILDKYENKDLSKYIMHITEIKNFSKYKKKLYDDIIEIINTRPDDINTNIYNLNNEIQNCINELDEIKMQLYNKEFGMSLHELYMYKKEAVEEVDFGVDFPSAEFTILKLENMKFAINVIAENLAKLNGNKLVRVVDDKVNLKCIDLKINTLTKIYDNLNKNNQLSSIKNIYNVYSNKSNIISDIERYENYINNKYSLIDKFKSKLFEMFKLNSIVNKLNLDKSKDNEFIKQELSRIRENIDLYKKLELEIENLNKLFTNQYIDELKKDIYNPDKFKGQLKQIKDLTEKIEYLHFIKSEREKLEPPQQHVIDVLIKEEIGVKKNIENLNEYWYKIIQNELVKSWIRFLESKHDLAYKASSHNNIYDEICKKLSDTLWKKTKIIPKEIERKIINNISNLEEDKIKNLQISIKKSNKKASNKKIISESIENGLLICKPIWLVTPEVATSILPLQQGLFDIIIFDEASQMALEDSIPCIYRGKKIVVAGDTKQLPPPKFNNIDLEVEEFDNLEVDEYKELLSNSESLLHYMKHKYHNSKVFLNYHYRSKYKELINFSNHAFYDGDINIVPNALYDEENEPIEYIYLEDGRINNGANMTEAKRLVDVLKETMKKYDNQSIGIVAFTKNQQKAIEKEIDDRKSIDLEFDSYYLNHINRDELDKRIFISNIDEIQGDQRDIIIFSVGYAPRESNGKVDGSITGNLNSKDGKYRLNVAISRAKNKIILLTSIRSNMLPPSSDEGEGRSLLKHYLDYCEAIFLNHKEKADKILKEVCSNKDINNLKYTNKDESPLETQIREALVNKGVCLNQQVQQLGFRIDMAVIDPRNANRYLLAIEADGATYHSSRTAKERDLYRQRLLEEKGWEFIRIWSKDWWNNKDREVERVLRKIEELTTNQYKNFK
ncbi:AAA domain-containing protein [Paeniclostridium sordellii]|uniref:AAA domain-containing protein n=1 Tax=Paraclostridium sordellii TaxID=1505 RepID=UPI002149AA5F|nr:AAA domain-containing protein [Paeniclostridium sordellii]MCR1847892.1 AAA domain-containing protein [Paeniclostridium sordellii]